MTLGTLKCNTIQDDATPANSITVADLTTLDTDKADLASPTFTGTVTVPATVAFTQDASDVTIPDNQSLALEVKQGDNAYITFDTTNDNEQVEVHKNLQLDEDLIFSAAKIISFPDDNTEALRFRQGSNNYIRFNTDDGNERTIFEQQIDAHDNIAILAQGELQLADTDSNRHIALRCTGTLGNTQTWTLPGDAPEAGDVLTVDTVADTHNPTLEWAPVATVSAANTWTAGQRGQITTLDSGATVNIDFNDSNNFVLTLGHNVTDITIENATAGQSGSIFIAQPTSGSTTHTVSGWDGAFKFPAGEAPTLSTAINKVDRVDYIIRSASQIHVVATLDMAV